MRFVLFILLGMSTFVMAQRGLPEVPEALIPLRDKAAQFLQSRDPAIADQVRSELKQVDATQQTMTPDYLKGKQLILNIIGDREAAREISMQLPDEVLEGRSDIFNRLQDYLRTRPEAMSPLIQKFAAKHPGGMADWLHQSMSQAITSHPPLQGTPMQQVLDDMGKDAESELAGLSAALRAYITAWQHRSDQAMVAQLAGKSYPNPYSREEVYRLLMLRLLPQNSAEIEPILDQMIKSSRTKVAAARPSRDRTQVGGPIYHRYMLARLLQEKAARQHRNGQKDQALATYKEAAEVAPDPHDGTLLRGYFYEMHATDGLKDFPAVHARYLLSLDRKTEALEALMGLCSRDSSLLATTRRLHRQLHPDADFDKKLADREFRDLPLAPDFTLNHVSGEAVSLTDFRGKWVLIDFWGTWCGPCRIESPQIEAFGKQVREKAADKAVMLTISGRDSLGAVKSYMKKNNYTFDVLMATDKVLMDYKVPHFPFKVMITPEGKRLEVSRNWIPDASKRLFGESESTSGKRPSMNIADQLRRISTARVAKTKYFGADDLRVVSDCLLEARLFRMAGDANTSLTISQTMAEKLGQGESFLQRWAQEGQIGSLIDLNRLDEAEKAARAFYHQTAEAHGKGSPPTQETLKLLATILNRKGEYEELAKIREQLASWSAQHHGPDAMETLRARSQLAGSYARIDRFEEANSIHQDIKVRAGLIFGEDSPMMAELKGSRAWTAYLKGDHKQAISLNREILEQNDEAWVRFNLGLALLSQGKATEAKGEYSQAIETADSASLLSSALVDLKKAQGKQLDQKVIQDLKNQVTEALDGFRKRTLAGLNKEAS